MPNLDAKQLDALNNWPRTTPAVWASFPYLGNTGNGFGDLIDSLYGDTHNHGTTTLLDGSITDTTSDNIDFGDLWIITTEGVRVTDDAEVGQVAIGYEEAFLGGLDTGVLWSFSPSGGPWGGIAFEQLIIDGDPLYLNALSGADLILGGDTDISGDLTVAVDLQVDGATTLIGALDVDDDITATGTADFGTFVTPYQQVVTVAKAGADFTTIQGAIDSITDATTTKRYMVKVQSGVYTEAVTLKDYVDLIGAGRTNTIIVGTSGTVLTFPANKCTVSEIGIDVDYSTLGAASTAITSAGADSVLKDCDITVTKSGGGFVMNAITVTAGAFRMSDCYFTYSITGATGAPQLIQSAVVQTGVLTTVILNNNEMTITSNDTDDHLVGFETTAAITGTCLLANNVIDVDCGAAGSSATGLWLYGTGTGAIFNQNRITVNCNASAYGLWIDSTAGGAVVDTRHNEIIVTAVGAAEGGDVLDGDTWNSVFDKITAKTAFTGAGTITFASSEVDGGFTTSGDIACGGDLVSDAVTGTKIGTATAQKLGFYNATPVDQPVAVADATGAGDVVAQLNLLLARVRELGLIAT
jgi:hypothetical protein